MEEFTLHEDEGIPLRRYVAAVLRYKWIVLAAVVLGVAGAYGAWNQMQPDYVAQGSLWVQASGSDDRGPIATEGLLQSSAWIDLLRSYAVLDSVVVEEKLYVRPQSPEDSTLFESFRLGERFAVGSFRLQVSEDGSRVIISQEGQAVAQAPPGDSLGGEIGFRWVPPEEELTPGRTAEFRVMSPRDASQDLAQKLRTEMDQQATFIKLELPGTNPGQIARVLNAIMERHVDLAADLKRGNLDEQRQILGEQLDRVEQELRRAERELESFRVRTITLPSEEEASPIQPGLEMTRDPVFRRYFDMKVRLDGIQQDRRRLEAILDSIPESGVRVESLEMIPSVRESSQLSGALDDLVQTRAQLRELLTQYTEEHPPVQDVQARVDRLQSTTIPSHIRELVDQLRAEERELSTQIESSGAELSDVPTRSIEEARLRRRVQIAENLYTELRSRYQEADLTEASSTPDVRILDRADVPRTPVNDQRTRMAMIIVLGSIGVGLAGTVLLERFDPRVRYPDQMEKDIGLMILGTIPRIERRNGNAAPRNSSEVYEAFRDLRTQVSYAFGSAGTLITAVSGPSKGEGKTLITTTLAISFAEMGKQTLLIDGDTRQGDAHAFLGLQRKPGLTDFLAGETPARKIVQRTEYDNLFLVASGSRMANSPELLTSSRMGEILAASKKDFDVVLVDSPPLGAGSDASILGSITGNLLLVVRSGSTNLEMTKAKLGGLERLPIRLLGGVLNDYQPGRLPGAYEYYGSYLPGYEATNEGEEEGRDNIVPEAT